MAKITELLENRAEFTFSYEVTPDISEAEIENVTVEPIFYSVTWHAKSHQNNSLDIPPLKLASRLRSKNKNVLLHLSCDFLRKERLFDIIELLQQQDIRNLFVILGDGYDPNTSDFKSSEDLIENIRKETGDYFCIGVAGLPECSDEKLLALKSKMDKGADFIITQAFFEGCMYKTFRNRCREIGIKGPIIPGIFYFMNHKQLSGFIKMCKIKVSQNILDYVNTPDSCEEIQGNLLIKKVISCISSETEVNYFHFFTMNKLQTVSSYITNNKLK